MFRNTEKNSGLKKPTNTRWNFSPLYISYDKPSSIIPDTRLSCE